MKRRKRGVGLDGILLLDKASGISSNQALQQVKRLFNAAKAGHTGSLDPLASGLLPVCFGQATRLAAFVLDRRKDYLVDIRLGHKTTTGDAEGEVILEGPVPHLSPEEVKAILDRFTGPIKQIPPMYSALKRDGIRLYEYARNGIEIERSARAVNIYELDLLDCSGDRLTLRVSCSKGTYIRTLAEDIGDEIGCGGHVETLRRTAVGGFRIEVAWSFDRLQALTSEQRNEQCLLPVDAAVSNWPRLELSRESVRNASQGRVIEASDPLPEGWVRMYTLDSQFFGIGQVLPNRRVAPRKVFLPSPNARSLSDLGETYCGGGKSVHISDHFR
ncbi:MAG: tRNA pseudouridine(55) synthase TruB [Methylococcales bacterium]